MKRLIQIIFLACSLYFIAGCTKKNPVPGRIALLTGRDWKLMNITITPAISIKIGTSVNTYYSLFNYYDDINAPCLKYKKFNFEAGTEDHQYEQGAYSFTDQSDCSVQPAIQVGTWNFLTGSDGTINLYLYKDRENGLINSIYTVEEISGDRLILSYKTSLSGSTATTVYIVRSIYQPE